MKDDQIVILGKNADAYANNQTSDSFDWKLIRDARFAQLVAAAEREALYREFCEWCNTVPHLDLDPRLHTHSGRIEDGGYISDGVTAKAFAAWQAARRATAAPQPQADALDTERLDWLIEQGCHHGVVYEGSDKSFWMVWLDGHDAHKDEHQIGRYHTAREAIDAAIASAKENK